MKPNLKIAIYSGEIPSTTFIERLIVGLSNNEYKVLLFGRIKRSVSYRQNVLVKGYRSGRIQKGIYLLYYTVLLISFRNKDKRKLDAILKSESRFSMYDCVKSYPVLWYKPDIFHVQWAKGIEEWSWVKSFGIKLVLSLRGAHINYSPIADKALPSIYKTRFPEVDGFHAVSKAIASEAEKYNAQKDKIKVVYSGLDLDVFEEIQPKLVNKASSFSIISVGRPHWKKGYTYALDAIKLLKDQAFQFTYTIVGGINLELKYQIEELALEDCVTIIDRVSFIEVQELIKASDLLLLPSTEEGVANVVLEAMAIGTLVLSTNCGGMEEVIVDGENGFVVPIRDSEAIANKIFEISKISKQDCNKITSKACETIKSQHTEALMVAGMHNLYQDL